MTKLKKKRIFTVWVDKNWHKKAKIVTCILLGPTFLKLKMLMKEEPYLFDDRKIKITIEEI